MRRPLRADWPHASGGGDDLIPQRKKIMLKTGYVIFCAACPGFFLNVHHIACSDVVFLLLSGKNKKMQFLNNSGRYRAHQPLFPSLTLLQNSRLFFFYFLFFFFMPRAHRAKEVTYLRLPPASCHRLRNHSPELKFPHRQTAGSKSVATAVCRHAGSARGGGARVGAGGTRAPPSRCRRPGPRFHERPERGAAARPRPPPPPDWPAAVCCPVAKAMPAADWRGAGGGGEGAGFAAYPRRTGAAPRGVGAARSPSEREGGGTRCPQSRPCRVPSPVPSPEGVSARAAEGCAPSVRSRRAQRTPRVRAAGLAALRARRFKPVGSCSSPR